ncbi:hypothetical protein [Streptosporangium sandarakinum]
MSSPWARRQAMRRPAMRPPRRRNAIGPVPLRASGVNAVTNASEPAVFVASTARRSTPCSAA